MPFSEESEREFQREQRESRRIYAQSRRDLWVIVGILAVLRASWELGLWLAAWIAGGPR